MRNFKNLFTIIALLTILVSCESDDVKYSGTPVGNQDIETLEGTISTTATVAMLNQLVPFKITIPRPFSDTVRVEVSTVNLSGTRFRTSVQLLPGEVEATDEVPCAGGVIYDTTVKLSITGITVQTPDPGKHFLMKSNVIELRTGNTPVPAINNSRMIVRLAWPNPPGDDPTVVRNSLTLQVTRPVGISNVSLQNGVRNYAILTMNPLSPVATNAYSSQTGDYIFRVGASSLMQSGVDIPYRFVVRFPEGKTEIFEGILPAATVGMTPQLALKATKSVDGLGRVSYVVTNQNL